VIIQSVKPTNIAGQTEMFTVAGPSVRNTLCQMR